MPDKNEPDQLLDHNYDGIQEFDNPMPRWWVYLFWATIVFSVLYWLNVPGIGTTVEVAGKSKGTLGGKAVSDAILNTWVGPKPGPGADFKKGVLGQ
jgi:cbb3-type cytochrome c oxidase subunit III